MKSKKIEGQCIGSQERWVTIPSKNKRKIAELFREYKTTKTPVLPPEKKKEWDDDLKENDIAATIMEKTHKNLTRHQSYQANLFEFFDDSQMEKVDLSLLPQQEEF